MYLDDAGNGLSRDVSKSDVVHIVPLPGLRNGANGSDLSVPPLKVAVAAASHFRKMREEGQVHLDDGTIDQLARSAVFPAGLSDARIVPRSTPHGWLWVLPTRVFTTLLSPSYANDRLLADAIFDADPSRQGNEHRTQIAMPEVPGGEASLQFGEADDVLLDAADHNFNKVLVDNPQSVGADIVHMDLTVVASRRRSQHDAATGVELTVVDGNSRLASCYDRMDVPVRMLPARLRGSGQRTVRLRPSLLMNMTFEERRQLTRNLLKMFIQAHSEVGTSPAAVHRRNAAAMAINAFTVPAEVIVGYVDQDRNDMSRFAPAVRSRLLKMNVEAKPLSDGSQDAVRAEEMVVELHSKDVISDTVRDILIGRSNVSGAMQELGLDPTLPDLRAALVFRELTRSEANRNKILRTKLGVAQMGLPQRVGPIVELTLRSYTASLRDPSAANPDARLNQTRSALRHTPIWRQLVTEPWEVTNVSTDQDVDNLTKAALEQVDNRGPESRLLGVLGLMAVVTTGRLLAPGGSAEDLIKSRVDRGSLGHIVEKMLTTTWGVLMLGDAIKRSRAHQRLRIWDAAQGTLVDHDSTGSQFNARLRQMVLEHDTGGCPEPTTTPDGAHEAALTNLYQSVSNVKAAMLKLQEVREGFGISEKLPFQATRGSLDALDAVRRNLEQITTAPPLGSPDDGWPHP
jgi:hypothetical protein